MTEWWLEGEFPPHGRVAVDVGSNVGLWTRRLAATFDHVHAIEPDPLALAGLRSNLPVNATVHPVAAWDRETQLDFALFASSEHTSCHFRGEGINTGPQTGMATIAGRPIDALGIDGPVDFFKCDTEGAELQCLRGAEQMIRRDRPWLLIEAHTQRNCIALARLLADWDYLLSIVRHPDYARHSPLWYAHCWFACQPLPIPGGRGLPAVR